MIDALWHEHDDMDALADAVADAVGAIVEGAVAARGAAVIALPGGTTPRPGFARLAEAPLPWDQVTIFPTDERLVEAGDRRGNFAMIEGGFAATGARVVRLAHVGADYHAAGRAADARLQALQWPPDLVWLGMGGDGHTASIFPGPDLENALAAPASCRAIGVLPDPLPPEAPVARVTLSRAAILAARAILVTITGEAKRTVLKRALADGSRSQFPIGRVLAGAAPPIAIHWCPT